MAIATQNDNSDLLILSDDTSDTLTFDAPISNEEIITESADMISFDTDNDLDITTNREEINEKKKEINENIETDDIFNFGSLDENIDEINTDVKTEINTDTLDLGIEDSGSIDLDLNQSEEKIESTISLDSETLDLGELNITSDNEVSDETIDLDIKEDSISEGLNLMEDKTVEPELKSLEKSKEVFNLKDATLGFVSQLNDRKDQISTQISSDEVNIDNRNSKISILKAEIADFNKSIKELKNEDKEIDNKIGLVSGNTAANNIKTTTSAKVHNVKRRKAVNNTKVIEKTEKVA